MNLMNLIGSGILISTGCTRQASNFMRLCHCLSSRVKLKRNLHLAPTFRAAFDHPDRQEQVTYQPLGTHSCSVFILSFPARRQPTLEPEMTWSIHVLPRLPVS